MIIYDNQFSGGKYILACEAYHFLRNTFSWGEVFNFTVRVISLPLQFYYVLLKKFLFIMSYENTMLASWNSLIYSLLCICGLPEINCFVYMLWHEGQDLERANEYSEIERKESETASYYVTPLDRNSLLCSKLALNPQRPSAFHVTALEGSHTLPGWKAPFAHAVSCPLVINTVFQTRISSCGFSASSDTVTGLFILCSY